jgi:hypothetical protein
MNEVIHTIEQDIEGLLVLVIDEVAWEVSDKLKALLLQELYGGLGGEFSEEFDPMIMNAINKINSCIKESDINGDDEPPTIYRVK